MTSKERVLSELQMLTGVITDDIDYIVFLLLKDGSYFKKDTAKQKHIERLYDINIIQDFDEWFKTL